ncbi:MAG: conjugal transfer protein [Solirubrobacteraceae bacterium]
MAVPTATVTVRSTSVRGLRVAREFPRYLLQVLALVGLLASARFAIAPPRPVVERPATPNSALPDRAAEGFASLFVRRYLTWDSAHPEDHRVGLSSFVGSSMEPDMGSQPPESGEQSVLWTQVVQVRAVPRGRVYTVAAQTDLSGLLYLTVGVVRTGAGALALAGYPAFVGAPASTSAVPLGDLREVEEPALTTVVTRTLRNYLGHAGTELAADLAPGAQVSLPGTTLALDSLQSLDWSSDGRSVLAVVQTHDERSARFTLAYELDVAPHAGRWEVSAIQTNPDT